MNTFFILSAKYLMILPVIILGIYFIKLPRSSWKNTLIFILPSLIITYIVALIAGHIYYDPRPFVVDGITPLISHAPDNGFPSDHALLVSAIAMVGIYLNRKLGITLWILAIIVAIARVYVGVHHTIDVVGSIVISIIVTSVVYALYKKYVVKRDIGRIK
jgi:undecaprenyl-diphosphatase